MPIIKNKNKLVIGLVGEKGSGKGTFAEILQRLAKDTWVKKVSFSDTLRGTLRIWDLPPTRENLQNLAIIINRQYGKTALADAVRAKIERISTDIVIVDGVRWAADVPMIRGFPNNILVYITAGPRVRYERTKRRKEKAGEAETSFKQFMKEEKAKTETLIAKIGSKADHKIVNNGGFEGI